MNFDAYTYYTIEATTTTYDRATGKYNEGKPVTIAKFDSYQEAYTRLIKEVADFLYTHIESVVGIMKEDGIGISYDQDEPVLKYQFFTATKHKS